MVIKTIKAALILLAVSLLLFSAWFSLEFYSPRKSMPQDVLFEIEPGKGARAIAQDLKQKGIIRKKWPFLVGYRLFFSSQSLKAGEYSFRLPLSTKGILATISKGRVFLHPLTIPEGLTRKEVAQYLDSQNFVNEQEFLEAASRTDMISDLDKEASNLEGYLFPETYHFAKQTPSEKIISTLVAQFKNIFNETWQKRAEEIGMTLREVVILASLIEKETSVADEKELVSAVFHNRLKKRMKLDCDPTIIYDLKEKGLFRERLHARDIKLDSPYNTYLHRGLPPGPICNPGQESLRAALYPADKPYLYFVSKNDGSHHFSSTFKEHQNAVMKYQKRRAK